VQQGHIYVAPADVHMLLHDHHIMLRRGPHENLARPAIDPLFRSAACSFGARVVGIVLSGALSDGTAGLRAIKACGGITMVQDPGDAVVSDMPRNALRHVEIDYCQPATLLGNTVVRLVSQPAGPMIPPPLSIRLEAAVSAQEIAPMGSMDQLGAPSRFTCPECQGTLWEIADGSLLRYRCHTGHAYTADTMLTAQAELVEGILWKLLRTHEERSGMAFRLAQHERQLRNEPLALRLESKAKRYEQDADLVRELLREGNLTGERAAENATNGETEERGQASG
jgi:two-component system chemotaxis response regulator CheB